MKRVAPTARIPKTILPFTAVFSLFFLIMSFAAFPQTTCKPPLTLCGSVCTNLLTDPKNCGSCGNVCSLLNATAYCSTGLCWVDSCNFGWGDCDGVFWNGCETNLLTSPKNCGACAFSCQGATACSSGQCK